MYVKSLVISPLLYTSISVPCTILSTNLYSAISGLPHGPYAVKNLRPVVESIRE